MVVSIVFPIVVSAATWLPAILAFAELTLREDDRRRTTDDHSLSTVHRLPSTDYRPLSTVPYSLPRELSYALITGILIAVQFLAGHVEVSYYILLVLAFYAAWRILGVNV